MENARQSDRIADVCAAEVPVEGRRKRHALIEPQTIIPPLTQNHFFCETNSYRPPAVLLRPHAAPARYTNGAATPHNAGSRPFRPTFSAIRTPFSARRA